MQSLIPISDLTEEKSNQLDNSSTSPQMYLSVERYKFEPTINATVYELEIGFKDGLNVKTQKMITRFSILEKLNYDIQTAYKGNSKLPVFPPKKYLWNTDPVFLESRQKDLQKYFESITKVEGISEVDAFKEFFEAQE